MHHFFNLSLVAASDSKRITASLQINKFILILTNSELAYKEKTVLGVWHFFAGNLSYINYNSFPNRVPWFAMTKANKGVGMLVDVIIEIWQWRYLDNDVIQHLHLFVYCQMSDGNLLADSWIGLRSNHCYDTISCKGGSVLASKGLRIHWEQCVHGIHIPHSVPPLSNVICT